MSKANSDSSAAVLGVFLVLALGLLGWLLGDAALSFKAMERTVTVKGLSEREVPADVATWPISFQVASNEFDDVFTQIESKTALVSEYLEGYGIERDEITPAPPAITDLYAQQWGDKQHIKFRYTGTGTLTVYTDKVDAVRRAMADVIELGKRGVAIGGPHGGPMQSQFLFTGLNDLKPEMIEEATRKAREVAAKFAQDSDSRLGKIRTASQGQFTISDRDTTTPHIKKVRVVSTIQYYLSD